MNGNFIVFVPQARPSHDRVPRWLYPGRRPPVSVSRRRIPVVRRVGASVYRAAEWALSDSPVTGRFAWTVALLCVLWWGYAVGAAAWGWPWPGVTQ